MVTSTTLVAVDKLTILRAARNVSSLVEEGNAQDYALLQPVPISMSNLESVEDNIRSAIEILREEISEWYREVVGTYDIVYSNRKSKQLDEEHYRVTHSQVLQYPEAWTIQNLEQANDVLKSKITYTSMEGGIKIRNLWTYLHNLVLQPGFFEGKPSKRNFLHRVDFLGWINGSTEDEISLEQLEAFLIKCNSEQVLFGLNGQRVDALEPGWELSDEVLIDPTGPARCKIIPSTHDPSAEVELILLQNQARLHMDDDKYRSFPRDYLQDQLGVLWKEQFPRSNRDLGRNTVDRLLEYFSSLGKFFISPV
jgi:hypothetical protein